MDTSPDSPPLPAVVDGLILTLLAVARQLMEDPDFVAFHDRLVDARLDTDATGDGGEALRQVVVEELRPALVSAALLGPWWELGLARGECPVLLCPDECRCWAHDQ